MMCFAKMQQEFLELVNNRVLFCVASAERLHWSLLIVGVMLLVCLSMLMFYCHHDFVKSKLFYFLFGINCVIFGGERKKTEYSF